jgi:hypothetical protein
MTMQTTDRLVHHYDTERRRILCGASGAEDHSTKHRRGVTCSECLALLREEAEHAAGRGSAVASGGTGV